jgi:alpha-L-fucosidase
VSALGVYGEWMKFHGRSIYGCTQSEFTAPADVRYTQNFETNRLYVHLLAYPFKHLHLPGLAGKVKYAQFLNDASELPLKLRDWTTEQLRRETGSDLLTLELPVIAPSVEVPVIELILK